MNSSKSISSLSRLQCLLLIAISGYEYALYQHFVWQVPLRPERVVELQAGQTPMGFLPDGVFAIGGGNLERIGSGPAPTSGPVEIRAIPSGELLKDYRLQPDDGGDGGFGTGMRAMPLRTTLEGWYGVVLRQLPNGEIEWSREDPYRRFRDYSTWKYPNLDRWTLDEEGHLHCSSDRTADRESGLGKSSEIRVRHPPVAIVGDRWAVFPNPYEQISGTPWLVFVAKDYLLRLGVLSRSASNESKLALYDLERREFVGLLNTSVSALSMDPQGRGFVIRRYPDVLRGLSRLEFFSAPPRRDWPWLLSRGLGVPAVIATIVLARWAVVHSRRRGAATRSGPNGYAASDV